MSVRRSPYDWTTSMVSSVEPSFTTMISSTGRVCAKMLSMHSHNINGRLKVGIIAHMVEDIGHETYLGDLTDKLHSTRIDDLMFLGFPAVVVLISRIGPSGRPE